MATLSVAACAGGAPLPKWSISSPAELCGDPTLQPDSFCMPSAQIENAFKDADFTITDAARSPSGTTAPYKVRLELSDGRTFSAKFKRAPDDFDSFNNSPRREVAAYELQKLFLDHDDYVVPPTIVYCLPLDEYPSLFPDIEPHGLSRCAVGVLAYWVEGISSDDVIDEGSWAVDPIYRDNLGNLNALTILIGHQDSIGKNFYRSTDPERRHLLSVDNGLAFGAMGVNPVQIFSSQWSHARVESFPSRTVSRLKAIDPGALERLRVVAELSLRDGAYVAVPHSEPIDPNEGVRERGGTVQLGLTAEEVTDVNVRLAKLIGEIGSGEVQQTPSVAHE